MNRTTGGYFLLALILFVIDRASKYWAVHYLKDTPYYINSFLSAELAFNRGISWSMFCSANPFLFGLLTIIIALIISILLYYTWYRFNQGYAIFGCVITVVGALSNVIDRLYYQGVVDFIAFSYHRWSWPIFNIADIYIMVGILYMAFYEI